MNSFAYISSFCRNLLILITFLQSIATSFAQKGEPMGRGFIAIPDSNGNVYLGWRLLLSDRTNVGFNVFRSIGSDKDWKKLNSAPIVNSCNFLDESPPKSPCFYGLGIDSDNPASVRWKIKYDPDTVNVGFIRIKLNGDYVFSKVGIADIDGDGEYDFVIKQPEQVTDPGVWQRSVTTFKVEAYRSDGRFLWRYDLGWNIEQGVWWSPMIVYDLDGDGRAEVALKTAPTDRDYRNAEGKVTEGPEYCSVLDGLTGREITKVNWIERGKVSDWGDDNNNRASRHLMGIAYLDGKRPSLIIMRGTYTRMRVDAYNYEKGELKLLWSWDGDKETPPVRGQGAHGFHAADIDGDGRDELILGSAVLDDNGKLLWNTGLGHPDAFYVTDIDRSRPGFEIIYGIEPSHKSNAICLVEAKTGKIIWGCQHPTTHVHSQGLLADIDPSSPGLEFYCGEKNLPDRWLYSASDGKLLAKDINLGSLAPNPIFWDDTPFKAYISRNTIVKYTKEQYGRIEGRVIAIADILGDWREEIITSVRGELRIYSTTIPSKQRRICLMQDRLYRTDVAMEAMGYLYPPQLGDYYFER
ncbi:MAG: silent information regulator protein Sir2 [Verrucomicrobiia bacterium]